MVRILLLAAALFLTAACARPPPPPAKRDIDFKTELSRKGEWIVVRPYGRVWHPNESVVGKGFVPYLTGGQWVPGSDGWEFEAEWGWGEYTFHYGRWFVASDLGWVWWPDQQRAASWVEWRHGSDYVAWSPLPPPPPANATLQPEPKRWNAVKGRHFAQQDLSKYLLPPDGVVKALGLIGEPAAGAEQRGPPVAFIRSQGGLTADGGIPDLTPPPEPMPALELAPSEETPDDDPPPPPKKKKGKKKKGK